MRRALKRVVRPLERGSDPSTSPLFGHILVGDAQGGLALHRVIPVPGCPVCGGPTPTLSDEPRAILFDTDEPVVVLEALAGWVDPLTGVIASLAVEEEPDLPVVITADPPHILVASGVRRLPVGWGKGLTLSGAIISAVGEALERYSASLPDPSRIVWARSRDLPDAERPGAVLHPRELPTHTEQQYARRDFPFVPFDDDVSHPWVAGEWLGEGNVVWVPAILAFLSLEVRAENVFCGGTSSGLAAGSSTVDASIRGVLELVERDAMLAAWLTGRPGHRIAVDHSFDAAFVPDLASDLRRVLANVASLGAEVTLVDLPTSAIGTTVMALARGDGVSFPGAVIGLGCALDPASAVRSAVLELGQTSPFLQRMMCSGQLRPPERPENVHELLDHAAWFFPLDHAQSFDRIVGEGEPTPLLDLAERRGAPVSVPKTLGIVGARSVRGNTAETLATLQGALASAEVRVAVVDVTSRDTALSPFRVVRALSPDLQPLAHGVGLEMETVPRIVRIGVDLHRPPVMPIW